LAAMGQYVVATDQCSRSVADTQRSRYVQVSAVHCVRGIVVSGESVSRRGLFAGRSVG